MPRIISIRKNTFLVASDGAVFDCKLAGGFFNAQKGEAPAVGDFVEIGAGDVITKILPRKNKISRRAAGSKPQEQIIAANVDIAFIVTSMNEEFNVSRIERYITMLDLQNIPYYVILTKSDLCENAELFSEKLNNLSIKFITTSVRDNVGLDDLFAMLTPNTTAVFIGSSGVGKSSLINHLLGAEEQKVSSIREDDARGRHTTTHRQLFAMPNGASIIDIPGMREIQLYAGANEISSFGDISQLSAQCKYRNCKHEIENDCAVLAAIENGELAEKRLKSYKKLQKEAERAAGKAKSVGRKV